VQLSGRADEIEMYRWLTGGLVIFSIVSVCASKPKLLDTTCSYNEVSNCPSFVPTQTQ
jgi:hypothetical protein